jgi:hypothetical protein
MLVGVAFLPHKKAKLRKHMRQSVHHNKETLVGSVIQATGRVEFED